MLLNKKQLTFFDAFSGIGGFRLGLEKNGFKCIGHCENNKFANKLYDAFFDTKKEYFYNDIRTIDTKTMPDFNIFCGGFPCQSFSIAGKRLGFDDERGTLIFDVIRILKDKRPRYFILENVKGLLNINKGEDFTKIIKILSQLGYRLQWQVVNSKCFGVPQNRERLFIIGSLGDDCIGKIFPISGTSTKNYIPTQETLVYWKNSKEKWVEQPRTYSPALTTQTDIWRRPLVKIGRMRKFKNENTFRKMKNNISPTLLARARQDGDGQPIISLTTDEKIRFRRLTPKECFRLQSFPDSMIQTAYNIGMSDSQLYRLSGNAVTVNVVAEIGKRLKDAA